MVYLIIDIFRRCELKRLFFILLLCFTVLFAAFSIDMSPHPGDMLETVFTVQDNVVISQAVSAPVDILHFDYFNINNANEICVSAEANDEALNPYYFLDLLSAVEAVAVSDIGYEMVNINLITVEDVAIYKTEFG